MFLNFMSTTNYICLIKIVGTTTNVNQGGSFFINNVIYTVQNTLQADHSYTFSITNKSTGQLLLTINNNVNGVLSSIFVFADSRNNAFSYYIINLNVTPLEGSLYNKTTLLTSNINVDKWGPVDTNYCYYLDNNSTVVYTVADSQVTV